MDFTLVMMLRRSHPGREVQGGAATCGWVLGGDSRGTRERLCHSRDKMPSWCDIASQGQGQQGAGSSGAGHAGRQAESRREKKEEAWSGPRRS